VIYWGHLSIILGVKSKNPKFYILNFVFNEIMTIENVKQIVIRKKWQMTNEKCKLRFLRKKGTSHFKQTKNVLLLK